MRDLGEITDAAAPALIPVVAAGAVIAARYRLEERLGAGGAGTVWRARDLQLDGEVALKLLVAMRSDGEVERWRREVAMARRIAHRNVCRVHDLGEHAGIRYVTMELVHGRGLRAMIGDELPPARARDLLVQIVAGAAAIHAAGVVHRDLKPDNVVVAGGGERAVIVDFGLAREPDAAPSASPARGGDRNGGGDGSDDPAVTERGAVVGTPAYMSPEQAAGGAVDARSDVWALGLIAHELLLGTRPGPGGDAPTVTAGAPPAPAPSSASTAAAIDRRAPGLGAIVARCLASDPAARFPDAIALAAALARPRHPRRRAFVIGGVAVATGAAALAAIALFVPGERGGEDAPRPRRDGPLTQRVLIDATPEGQPGPGALSIDGRRVAYTVHHRIYVRALDGGAPAEWPGPAVTTAWADGFFPDGTVVIHGAKPDGGWGVWRIAPAAPPELLHEESQRVQVAVAPDSARVALGISERGVLILDAQTREIRRLAGAARGEAISGISWSPDGRAVVFSRSGAGASEDTIEIAMIADGATRVVKRGSLGHWIEQVLVWPERDRLLYTAEEPTAVTLRELDLATLADRERTRWPGENVVAGSYGGGVLLLHRGTVQYGVWTAQLDRRGRPSGWARASTAELAGRVAGWTPDGRMVYVERRNGAIATMTQRPGEPPVALPGAADMRPESLVFDAVIVRRAPAAGKIAIARVAGGAARDLTSVAADSAGNNLVRCAGDRAPPCVIEVVQAGRIAWREIDPDTGALGAQLHEAPPSARFQRNAALSPDGQTLAVVDGGDAVTFVPRGGTARTVPVGRGAELFSVAFAHDGNSVLVTAIGHRGYIFNLIRVGLDGAVDDELDNQWERWYFRPAENRDGTQLAVDTHEFHLAIWRVDGI